MSVTFAHYPAEALKAYGRATKVISDAYKRRGESISPIDYSRCQDYPALGFTTLLTKAIRAGVLTDRDDYLISLYFDDIPGDFSVPEGRVPNEDQCTWILGYWGGTTHTMTASQAAERLGVSAPMISKLIDQGKLDAVKMDGKWYITPRSVTQYRINVQGKEDDDVQVG